jgi:hypothetical protein
MTRSLKVLTIGAVVGLMGAAMTAPATAANLFHASIGGKIGGNHLEYDKVNGPGDFTPSGHVAADENGAPTGSITIHYKNTNTSCTFVPNAGSSIRLDNWAGTVGNLPNDGQANDVFLENWSTDCVTGAFADQADLVLIDRSNYGGHPSEHRGALRVDADTVAGPGTYDVGNEGQSAPLDNGNVHIHQ